MARPFGWDQAAEAGLIAVCPITGLEFFYNARSAADQTKLVSDMRSVFDWVPVDDCVPPFGHLAVGVVRLTMTSWDKLKPLGRQGGSWAAKRPLDGRRPARTSGGEPSAFVPQPKTKERHTSDH